MAHDEPPDVAFVLSGGAGLGAIQVGMLPRDGGASKTRLAAVANPAMTSGRTSFDTRAELGAIVGWRRGRLVAAGFSPELAARLAQESRIDLHAVLELIDRGCPPALAARILAPLDRDLRPC
jgi:hypothetical protein